MSYHIRIMKPSQIEMRRTFRYIAEDLQNPAAASILIALIDEAIQALKKKPKQYPLVRDDYLSARGYRLMVVRNHLIFYIVREELKTVSVMCVLYGRRDWMHLLRAEEEGSEAE